MNERLAPEGFDSWPAYWQTQGMPWRTEPEIDAERQRFLAERRAVTPDIQRGICPFRDESGSIKLTRADVEWLLATHESGGMRGPVDWDDGPQRKREGVDLRGAYLSGMNLSILPLARMRGGLTGGEAQRVTTDQRRMAAVHMEGVRLSYTRLEGCVLTLAHCEGAMLNGAHLEGADLFRMHLESDPPGRLINAVFDAKTTLDRITLGNKHHIGPRLLGVRWGGARLTGIDWSSVRMLDDEKYAHEPILSAGHEAKRSLRQRESERYERALQATRQLAITLRDQGLNEDADRFAYRAQLLQREVLRRQGKWGRAFGSWLLYIIAGYGYRPLRTLFWYLAVVGSFAYAYYLATRRLLTFGLPPSQFQKLAWYEALVLSVSSFHGRGFLPFPNLGDPVTILAAIEAIFGLLIEIVFIATFTQRFFAR